ncbi:L-dopachrome tautomerase-related protein [uncultured Roseibium sp.]|uniref:L-dopachrome tautomerase-related protein n=1 Tax=uncultured Roseibium sp. TaxID=1936171 RepID=UPI0026202DA9|nr:L-dopachrome tautomerase-related protein [uncultured Roseibium sp.]
MKRLKWAAVAFTATVLGAGVAFADAGPEAEVIAEWNSLPYKVLSEDVRSTWEKSGVFGKALIQGAKLDSDGNIYVSTARWGGPEIPATLSKLVKEGDQWVLEPYPSEDMNAAGHPTGLKAVLGFEIDRNDVMWILDQGHVAGKMAEGDAKLVLWDIKAGKEIVRYVFSADEADPKCSFLNDIAVDNDTGFAYITDSGIFCNPLHGGLIAYDSKSNTARRLLDQHRFTNDEPHFFFNIDDRQVLKNGGMKTGADGIALSGDKGTLYWTNLTGNTLYSLDTDLLRDFNTSETVLENAVRVETSLPSNTDGMTADRDGNVYMTALSLDGLMKLDGKTGQLSRFAHHPEMNWPDTLAWGPDGALYVVSNHLHVWVDGDMNFEDPQIPNFRIWRIPGVGQSYTAE